MYAELCHTTTLGRTLMLHQSSAHIADNLSTRVSNMELGSGPLGHGNASCKSLLDWHEHIQCILLRWCRKAHSRFDITTGSMFDCKPIVAIVNDFLALCRHKGLAELGAC